MKKLIIIFLILNNVLLSGYSQENKSEFKQSKWSIEYSLAGTALNIYALQAAYQYNNKGQWLIGSCFQNYKNNQGRAHAYTLLIGYRYKIWKNFSVEYEFFPAYNEFHSSIDNKNYYGLELYSELRPGYQFDFKIGNQSLYVLPQLTIGFGIWTNNKWPDFDKQSNPAILGNLWLGIRL